MVKLRSPKPDEHEFLLTLRRKNDVYFFTDAKGDMGSHICWYKRIEADPTEHFFVIDVQGEPVGTISLSNIDLLNHRAEYGRLCIVSQHRRRGYATMAMQELLTFAFGELGLHRVWGDLFAFNAEAIKLDMRLGFRQEGIFHDHILKSCLYLDVVRMAILEDEWRSHNAGL